ncbi:MAG: TetR/AcrR family transcriptional regulator [Eubacterium sp.]|nr:TetR/AcrR family transcriptional regulator [Eubacterium sp.]
MFNDHHKEAFERIPDERRERILEIATNEFSSKGYENANINIIARNAGISIGLMYKYFSTKEDLFLTCIARGMEILEHTLEDLMESRDKLLIKAEKLIRAACDLSRKNENYIRLYNELTAEKDSKRAVSLAREIEGRTSRIYITAIAQALASGDVRQDLNPRLFAFFLANLLTTLQFSFTCEYYKERLKIYTGIDTELLNEDEIVNQLLKFIESAFTFEK